MALMKTKQSDVSRIAILRALYLGDMLCCIPAIRALRHASPEATITLLGLPWAVSFVERFRHYFDDFIAFPGFPGLPEQPVDGRKIVSFLQDAQEHRFHLALQMHGS